MDPTRDPADQTPQQPTSPAPAAAPEPGADGPDPLTVRTTTVNRSWVLKMGVFMVLLLGFGVWALADAVWIYPKRGEEYAELKLKDFLVSAQRANKLWDDYVRPDDPRAELRDLVNRERELTARRDDTSLAGRQAAADLAKLEWLRALARVYRLDDAPNRIEDNPVAQRDRMEREWETRTQPTGLSAYDIPVQWIFLVIGFGGGIWLAAKIIKARRTTFGWDPATYTLTLPDGGKVAPAEIKEFDKREWHKFFITLHLENGRAHRLDLLKFVPLEAWVEKMREVRFPEQFAEEAEAKAEAERVEAAAATNA